VASLEPLKVRKGFLRLEISVRVQGCQIFLGKIYQHGENTQKITKYIKIYKIYQMANQ
jgi:hypothetical protein